MWTKVADVGGHERIGIFETGAKETPRGIGAQ
jgi:hypothetical protein